MNYSEMAEMAEITETNLELSILNLKPYFDTVLAAYGQRTPAFWRGFCPHQFDKVDKADTNLLSLDSFCHGSLDMAGYGDNMLTYSRENSKAHRGKNTHHPLHLKARRLMIHIHHSMAPTHMGLRNNIQAPV